MIRLYFLFSLFLVLTQKLSAEPLQEFVQLERWRLLNSKLTRSQLQSGLNQLSKWSIHQKLCLEWDEKGNIFPTNCLMSYALSSTISTDLQRFQSLRVPTLNDLGKQCIRTKKLILEQDRVVLRPHADHLPKECRQLL